ncbi:MAG: glycosyltransferase [Bdellovibrionales bacterium]|nr:glycosyltransferase [Bdellovibrionales bacterium]
MNGSIEGVRKLNFMKDLNVGIFSKSDAGGGGASRVAEQLTELLRSFGVPVVHWVKRASNRMKPAGVRRIYSHPVLRTMYEGARVVDRKLGLAEVIPFEWPGLIHHGIPNAHNIFHFHDISTSFSPLSLPVLSRKAPVFWTIHDCSPFTGGCLYPHECNKFKNSCGACPRLGEWPIDGWIDTTHWIHSIKRAIFSRADIHLIAPSRWMSDRICEAAVFKNKPVHIPYGVDTLTFRPLAQNQVRDLLNLPRDRLLVLISAFNLDDSRKGVLTSIKALHAVADLDPYVLIMGNPSRRLANELAPLSFREFGYIHDDLLKAQIYSAADVFLFCSIADNLPLAVLETMSSGTPTVGFATGGIPELVLHERIGYLVDNGDIDGLASGLRLASDSATRLRWSEGCAIRAREHFSNSQFLNRHLALYQAAHQKNQ